MQVNILRNPSNSKKPSCSNSTITKSINAVATIILSAIGSNNSPNFDSTPNILANIPSRKSVKDATINNIKAVKSP